MALTLQNVSKRVGADIHIRDVSLHLETGSLNVLLGPTLSGKTSLMRLMAGLDKPTEGDVLVDGESVVGMAVQKRNVAMVYQQFINYPTLSVYENIASPMRVAGADKATIDAKVREAAELLKLGDLLDRTPLHLSGGQQQRTALARALVKGADLVLLDEPLANLDYKLREELRVELPKIFARTGAVFVYATTEPHEALLLGGKTATLSEGRITQFGTTIDVYNRPADLITASTFSDPPMNLVPMVKAQGMMSFGGGSVAVPSSAQDLADGAYKVGIRPHHLLLHRPEGSALEVQAAVSTTEITGSESFIHVESDGERWVALTHGVHRVEIGDRIPVYLDPSAFFVFDAADRLVAAPSGLR
ncbi:ABC transporter ATP-binding protein [Pelagibius litoralis]|uniref:ABC transporter ATP-binding protein n=1 Tax=Pelagibius litoralis TaxID=374515 RepID=A0A967CC67_9PROT|nr:ABC transporter ATP-binding protein [Pelagibius litoralis]NIA68863.1 ABC transporter ATP-binding protein [Pelagibius litoralis]